MVGRSNGIGSQMNEGTKKKTRTRKTVRKRKEKKVEEAYTFRTSFRLFSFYFQQDSKLFLSVEADFLTKMVKGNVLCDVER